MVRTKTHGITTGEERTSLMERSIASPEGDGEYDMVLEITRGSKSLSHTSSKRERDFREYACGQETVAGAARDFEVTRLARQFSSMSTSGQAM